VISCEGLSSFFSQNRSESRELKVSVLGILWAGGGGGEEAAGDGHHGGGLWSSESLDCADCCFFFFVFSFRDSPPCSSRSCSPISPPITKVAWMALFLSFSLSFFLSFSLFLFFLLIAFKLAVFIGIPPGIASKTMISRNC